MQSRIVCVMRQLLSRGRLKHGNEFAENRNSVEAGILDQIVSKSRDTNKSWESMGKESTHHGR